MSEGTILFGGSGFLGRAILETCPSIVSVGRTAPSTPNRHVHVDRLADLGVLRDIAFDKVIYAIGNSDRPSMEREHSRPGDPTPFDYHVIPLIQTLEQLAHFPISKLIHFSTILLYDQKTMTLPVSERQSINPYKNRYVMSQYLGEEVCKFYSRTIPIVSVRLSNAYGPSRRERFDLIYMLIRQVLDQGRATVLSTRPERDFIYVEDAADAVVKLLAADYAGPLNLGTGRMTSVRRIVDLLREISGCPIVDLDRPVEGPMRFRCDVSTLQRLIDWRPRYSIEDGVRRTYERMASWRKS
jgi:nucleoside-diphosphate-sugar epimerase